MSDGQSDEHKIWFILSSIALVAILSASYAIQFCCAHLQPSIWVYRDIALLLRMSGVYPV